ncbi:hypothetical protein [Microlunatus sp. Gsoil 973]|jgi:hypothetical protein|uniref:hypothetical protein n=1 Tax=Microlunatus sp. Gsoil 973 TaxID=2672569 RepID=UPI0012B4AFEA|nr:hypothetical protein [Microlunatus sp. Gsoil 973]QGN32314.1 hypothetical protein GJV80_05380 [Microlunatus sp. Gsoil 973]
MTTESPRTRNTAGPSIHVVRARKLLYGGLVGGCSAALVCVIIFGITGGVKGLASAALGAGMVLFFYVVGQLVMVAFADAGARTLLSVSMASYTGRVVILGLILVIFQNNRDAWAAIDTRAVFVAVIAVVAGWLIVEVLVFRRLRIGIYDSEYEAPTAAVEVEESRSERRTLDPEAEADQAQAEPRRDEGTGDDR